MKSKIRTTARTPMMHENANFQSSFVSPATSAARLRSRQIPSVGSGPEANACAGFLGVEPN
jgi:hypothetical protein